ncbi:MAG TPA: DsrE/DsrF/DrsH-like family protein [Pseudolabrys sp.]|jgi:predicted peroxiredoxin|nr:DsrE/DsrF/DrsH-like family protein [Pseudolabrys sp.]
MSGPSRRLLILLLNTDPRNVEELAAPLYYAAVAAAMDHEVDVLCTATAGKLLFKGVADKLHVKAGDPKTVHDWIKEAHDQGARFWACPANLELFDKDDSELIAECSGMMGAAAMIQTIMDGESRVLTF